MKLTFLAFVALLSSTSFGQITFEHGTLEEALAKAKTAKKPLFVDVYATWCGPCKQMAATAFVDPEVTAFYNKSFISLKLDGEKNDGPSVMQKYGISAYPTLLYFNANGELAGKVVGALQAKQLLSKGQEIVNPEGNPVFAATKVYNKSKKKQTDLKTYVQVLSVNEHDSLPKYAEEYYKKYPNLNLKDSVELKVFLAAVHDYKSPLSKQFLNDEQNVKNQEAYLGKINDYFMTTYQAAKTANSFEMMENMVVEIFPYLQKCNIPDLPSQADYLVYVKEQFGK
ncbi:thioredoxin family protein [Fluviicola taffensis]|uniref:Thioredoxin domain-containing protein n=1 Tax=Fluviicola taffensis (strain DSM 16823 / NCIMB 13979 / RW262) TaxID=755732 RepID=F2IJZ0_FLUTR|nr:thioredoxin family protein [Fluviicola taffensis]AEA45049.1 Thioredoxin domain-containing protein [Fluviicola taffensis DSM 16823]